MAPVKRESSTTPNPVQQRLLLLAELVAPPANAPTLAYLERLAKLTRGWLKDAGKNNSVSKALAAALVDAAPRLGIVGLSTDWLMRGVGEAPRRGGKTPPGLPQAERPAVRERAGRESYPGGQRGEAASSEPLSPEQIADEVGEVLEPLVQQLAAKGESVVARWLLAVAGEANDQSVDNVRPLIDLARDFLWRAERVR